MPGKPDKYALTQVNIPFGGGFKFQLFDNIELGFELVPRLTFTDYLDDVSTTYPNLEALAQSSGQLAADLSERSLDGRYSEGQIRGNPGSNDSYFVTAFTLKYNI